MYVECVERCKRRGGGRPARSLRQRWRRAGCEVLGACVSVLRHAGRFPTLYSVCRTTLLGANLLAHIISKCGVLQCPRYVYAQISVLHATCYWNACTCVLLLQEARCHA